INLGSHWRSQWHTTCQSKMDSTLGHRIESGDETGARRKTGRCTGNHGKCPQHAIRCSDGCSHGGDLIQQETPG
ncbi:MAG: hypothetical protein KDA84_04875, partial [Planctomycetaceae bacterium]|nr:hypothetical protein [Planctomycetaceae bacterium]